MSKSANGDETGSKVEILGIELAAAPPGEQLALEIDLPFTIDVEGPPRVQPQVVDSNNPKKERKQHTQDPFEAEVTFSTGDITLYAPDLSLEEEVITTQGGVAGLRTSGDTDLAKLDIDLDFLLSAMTVPTAIRCGCGILLRRDRYRQCTARPD